MNVNKKKLSVKERINLIYNYMYSYSIVWYRINMFCCKKKCLCIQIMVGFESLVVDIKM